MIDWYLKVVRQYAYFGGRAGRSEFWYFTLVNIAVSVALQTVGALATAALGSVGSAIGYLCSGIALLYSLAVLVPSVAVGVRRLHDTGRSGWWILVSLVPVIGLLVLLYFYILDSAPEANRWGPSPKAMVAADTSPYVVDNRV
ncbi:MAG: DUF805 domain-containing protein [Vulcanimicrobiaceae bacterium]